MNESNTVALPASDRTFVFGAKTGALVVRKTEAGSELLYVLVYIAWLYLIHEKS